MKDWYQIIYLCIVSLIFNSCNFFYQTVKVEVPKGYVGWVYVIPVKDTTGLQIQTHRSNYKINQHGIAYVPAQVLNIKKDSKVLVFEENNNISSAMRYAGSVYKVKADKKKYEYIQFYLPTLKEREIPDGSQYWRDKSWTYSTPDHPRFDSLLQLGVIEFK